MAEAKKLEINDITILPGKSYHINLQIAKLPTRTNIEIPMIIHRGKKEGPVLLLMAGVHGDEINGIAILRKIIADNLHIPESGTVICIPLFNVYAFLNLSRELRDGKDLNRMFPGSNKGSLASRMAFALSDKILPHIDYAIDFHTGGQSRENFPQIRCSFADKKAYKLAQAFNAPIIVNAPYRENSLRLTAKKMGKTMILFEGGESLRMNSNVVAEGVQGVIRVMHHLKMSKKKPAKTSKPTNIKSSKWIRAKYSGLFHCKIENGQKIKKGERLGLITDTFGEFEHEIIAPKTGIIIGLNNLPVINQGDALFHLGW